jgi:hypothetical protein
MMRLLRLKPLAAVVAALILATAGVAVQGRQNPATDGARAQAKTALPPTAVPDLPANRVLAREQLALIDKAWPMVDRLARTGRFSFSEFSLWGNRKLETLRKTGAGKAEMVSALEKYVNTLKAHEAIAIVRNQSGLATQVDVYDVQFLRTAAEVWLNEEKAR